MGKMHTNGPLLLMVKGCVGSFIILVFVKLNVWTLEQAYKVHEKEVKNVKPKNR